MKVLKRMNHRMFLVLMATILARTHPSVLHAAGVRTPRPGWVSLRSLAALPPFARTQGRVSAAAIMRLAAGCFMAKGPMVIRTPREPVVSIDLDPERVSFGEKALDVAQRALMPCKEKQSGGLTLEDILKLDDEALIPYLRGGLVVVTNVFLGLLQDPARLDKKLAEWQRVLRPLLPYMGRLHVYLAVCNQIDHETIQTWLRTVGKKSKDDDTDC
jgi:hypothetical protein